MKKYLWLDDIRNPNLSVWQYEYIPEFDKSVDSLVWVKEFPEFVNYINEFIFFPVVWHFSFHLSTILYLSLLWQYFPFGQSYLLLTETLNLF